MPLTKIHLRAGRSQADKEAIASAIQGALIEHLGIPEDDRFQRSDEIKKALIGGITNRLVEAVGQRPDDVFIMLSEVTGSGVSFGNGLTQRAP